MLRKLSSRREIVKFCVTFYGREDVRKWYLMGILRNTWNLVGFFGNKSPKELVVSAFLQMFYPIS
jgi:hypothetical protein